MYKVDIHEKLKHILNIKLIFTTTNLSKHNYHYLEIKTSIKNTFN